MARRYDTSLYRLSHNRLLGRGSLGNNNARKALHGIAMIRTVKELKAYNAIGHSIYRLSGEFTVYGSKVNLRGESTPDVWTTDEYFIYDGSVLIAVSDKSAINPAILFKAKVYLLTPKEWS